MKALTILDPWATLICEGKKTIETRNWDTNYRGKILIHTSRRSMPDKRYEEYRNENFVEHDSYKGYIIGEVDLVDIKPFEEVLEKIIQNKDIINYCTVEMGSRFAWILDNAKIYDKPIPAKGNLGLWDYNL